MSLAVASKIANYLTTGFHSYTGVYAGPFRVSAGDTMRVWMDFTGKVDLGIVRLALDSWSSVTGFRFVLNGTSGNHQLRLTDSDNGAYAYSYHAGDGTRLSSVVNVGQDWQAAYGTATVSYYTQTWVHEIGHALGLGHAGPYNGWANWGDQAFGQDSWLMSVMSYFSPDENPNVSASAGYVLTPMPADILAIQRLYGAPRDTGSDIYGFGGTADGIYARFSDMLDQGRTSEPVLLTIWDGGGRDMLNLSRDDHDQRIDLRPGAYSDVLGWKNTLAIAYGTVIENALGGRGNDTIIGNHADNRLVGNAGADLIRGGGGNDAIGGGAGNDRLGGGWGHDRIWGGSGDDRLWGSVGNDMLDGGTGHDSLFGGGGNDILRGRAGHDLLKGDDGDDRLNGGWGNDTMLGGAGDDIFYGGAGSDLMTGGAGADRFIFREARPAFEMDRITDFTSGEDIIDLRGLGIQGFARGAGPLAEDVLRIIDRGNDLLLRADLDGDGRADLSILALDCDAIVRGDLLI